LFFSKPSFSGVGARGTLEILPLDDPHIAYSKNSNSPKRIDTKKSRFGTSRIGLGYFTKFSGRFETEVDIYNETYLVDEYINRKQPDDVERVSAIFPFADVVLM